MLINYKIVMCGIYMERQNFDAKDSTPDAIRDDYANLPMSDADLLAFARYLSYYAQRPWAELLLESRAQQLDVDEDLLFYYINLQLFHPISFGLEPVMKAALNAININGPRFCRLFNSMQKGGASFQLLETEELRKIYCEGCR